MTRLKKSRKKTRPAGFFIYIYLFSYIFNKF
jgi:hypothetical protein